MSLHDEVTEFDEYVDVTLIDDHDQEEVELWYARQRYKADRSATGDEVPTARQNYKLMAYLD